MDESVNNGKDFKDEDLDEDMSGRRKVAKKKSKTRSVPARRTIKKKIVRGRGTASIIRRKKR